MLIFVIFFFICCVKINDNCVLINFNNVYLKSDIDRIEININFLVMVFFFCWSYYMIVFDV